MFRARSRSRSKSPANEKKEVNKDAKKLFDEIEGLKHDLSTPQVDIKQKRFFDYIKAVDNCQSKINDHFIESMFELLKSIVDQATEKLKRKVNLKTPLNDSKVKSIVDYLHQLNNYLEYYPRVLGLIEISLQNTENYSIDVQLQYFINKAFHTIIQHYQLIDYITSSLHEFRLDNAMPAPSHFIDIIHYMRIWKTEDEHGKRYIGKLTETIENDAVRDYVTIFLSISKATFTVAQFNTKGKSYIDLECGRFKQCVDTELLDYLKNVMLITFVNVRHEMQANATRGVTHTFNEEEEVLN